MRNLRRLSNNQFESCQIRVKEFIAENKLDNASLEIQRMIQSVAGRPESTMNFMPSKQLDALIYSLAKAWRGVNEVMLRSHSKAKEQGDEKKDLLILTSALYLHGGHSREIEDWVAALSDQHKLAILLSFHKNKADSTIKGKLFEKVEGYEHGYKTFAKTLFWLVTTIEAINPKTIVVSPAEDDVALFCALAICQFEGRLILNLNLDHNVSPGLFLKAVDQIVVKRPYLYEVIKNTYKLDKVVYIPFSRPSLTTGLISINEENGRPKIVTASCTSARYKIENDYIYQFNDVVSELICRTGCTHVHIGSIDERRKQGILSKIAACGYDQSHFLHIPYAAKLSDVFTNQKVNVLLQTFPVGGGLVPIEAMEAGMVIVNHRCYVTKLYNQADFCYEGSLFWEEPEDLYSLIEGMSTDAIRWHQNKSREYYNKFNRPGQMEVLLVDSSYLGSPVDEAHIRSIFDYPLDELRISANRGVGSFLKKKANKSFKTRFKRLQSKMKRYF